MPLGLALVLQYFSLYLEGGIISMLTWVVGLILVSAPKRFSDDFPEPGARFTGLVLFGGEFQNLGSSNNETTLRGRRPFWAPDPQMES